MGGAARAPPWEQHVREGNSGLGSALSSERIKWKNRVVADREDWLDGTTESPRGRADAPRAQAWAARGGAAGEGGSEQRHRTGFHPGSEGRPLPLPIASASVWRAWLHISSYSTRRPQPLPARAVAGRPSHHPLVVPRMPAARRRAPAPRTSALRRCNNNRRSSTAQHSGSRRGCPDRETAYSRPCTPGRGRAGQWSRPGSRPGEPRPPALVATCASTVLARARA